MNALRFGLIGSGFMGRAHAIALKSVATVFDDVTAPVCELLADSDAERARESGHVLGFRRTTGDWRTLVADPAIDVVDICAPNHLHHEMALAAVRVGKHVYCEKPLALDSEQAREIALAAQEAGVRHAIGFNYACNPLIRHAVALVRGGAIGQLTAFRGSYCEDYMGDPARPFSWRCERRLAGSGALADLGSHLINMAHELAGPIARVAAMTRTIHRERLDLTTGSRRAVENEDLAIAMLEFECGIAGSFEVSRIATGRKCGLEFSLTGTAGAIAFDQERMNELRLYRVGDPRGEEGFRTILAGPEHPDYAGFCPAPGHGLGINDLKVIELHTFLQSIAAGRSIGPDFNEGLRVQTVMDAIERAAGSGLWCEVASVIGTAA